MNVKTEAWRKWRDPQIVLLFCGIFLVSVIVITALVRERIVNPLTNQVTVTGQGKVAYQPDIAVVVLGVKISKADSAENALNQLNDKINGIVNAIEGAGIKKENIQTQSYSLYPQYDFKDGVSEQSGYDATQKLSIKIEDIKNNPDYVSQVIAAASGAGTNQVEGISFDVSSVSDLKQQARILAIEDAKVKATELSQATGTELGKIIGWYENVIGDYQAPIMDLGFGGSSEKSIPNVPAGTQEIIVEMGLNYEVE